MSGADVSRTFLFPGLLLGLCLIALAVQKAPRAAAAEPVPGYRGPVMANPEPHGVKVCASACALSRHPTPALPEERFRLLRAAYSREPMSEKSPALEELLFYGRQTRLFLARLGPGPLDAERAEFLARELRRTHAQVEFRLLDEDGTVRAWMPPKSVPLDLRHRYKPLETEDFQSPETSGTVKRVGLYHIWQRI